MTSIRKTKSSTQSFRKAKKRLKREIKRLLVDKIRLNDKPAGYWQTVCEIRLAEQELQQLKRKKR